MPAQIVPLGSYSPAIYAAISVTGLTLLNMAGLRQRQTCPNLGNFSPGAGPAAGHCCWAWPLPRQRVPPQSSANGPPGAGAGVCHAVLTEAGTKLPTFPLKLSNPAANMVRSLLWGIAAITTVYVLINWAYLHSLGVSGMARFQAIAADLLCQTLGEPGALLVSLLVVLATLGSINASILTGARTNYAVGQDISPLKLSGSAGSLEPVPPQQPTCFRGAIALALVGLGHPDPAGV